MKAKINKEKNLVLLAGLQKRNLSVAVSHATAWRVDPDRARTHFAPYQR
jgi:hypothetical protein